MNVIFFRSAAEFRRWLETHHATETELWVGFYRKESGRGGITYPEALDQALCFGWIDGVRRKVDDESYTNRFSPRKPRSAWSLVNIRRVEELTKRGLMAAAGLAAFRSRDANRSGHAIADRPASLSGALEKTFRANAKAWSFFRAQPPGYQRTAVFWVTSAAREETRLRRLSTLIDLSQHGRRLPMLTPPSKKL